MTNKTKKVSIIMVNYNGSKFMGRKDLTEAIESFLNTNYKNLEFIFVDNNSIDDSINVAKKVFKQYPKIITKIVKTDKNMGFAGGCEEGMKYAEGHYIALVNNDDKVLDKNWLKPLLRVLNSSEDIGAVFPKKLLWDNPNLIDSIGLTINPMGFVTLPGRGKINGREYNRVTESLIWQTPVLFRKKLIDELNGFFDIDYAPLSGHDDTDSSIRIWQRGYKILYVPQSTVLHKRGATMKYMSREAAIFHGRKNILQTMLKNYELKNIIRYTFLTFIIYILAIPYYLWKKRMHQAKGTIKALLWIFWNLPKIIKKRTKVQSLRKVRDKEYFIYCSKIDWLDILRRRKREPLDEV